MKILNNTKRGARRGASRSRPGRELLRFVKKPQLLWLLLGIGGGVLLTVIALLFLRLGSESDTSPVTQGKSQNNVKVNSSDQPVFEFYKVLSANSGEMLFDKTIVQRKQGSKVNKENIAKISKEKTAGVKEHIIFKSRLDLAFSEAKILYTKLLQLGLDPHILKLYTSNGYRYRVQLGPFASREKLSMVQKKMPLALQSKFSL